MDDNFLFPMASRLNKPASGILWYFEDSLIVILILQMPSSFIVPKLMGYTPHYVVK